MPSDPWVVSNARVGILWSENSENQSYLQRTRGDERGERMLINAHYLNFFLKELSWLVLQAQLAMKERCDEIQ